MDESDLDLLHIEADARDDAIMTACGEETGHKNVEWLDYEVTDPYRLSWDGRCEDCGAAVSGVSSSHDEKPREWS